MTTENISYASPMKVSHRAIAIEMVSRIFQEGTRRSTIKNPVWKGAYLIYSYIEKENGVLHLFYHDPVNGTPLEKNQDITTVELTHTIILSED